MVAFNSKSDQEWQEELSTEQYQICREKGTERAFSGKYNDCKTAGTYRCVCCGNALFDSENKYDSGSGWPSFWEPMNEESLFSEHDNSHFMQRTEVVCKKCEAHLGHVFEDGPQPTGLRYCINSVSLILDET